MDSDAGRPESPLSYQLHSDSDDGAGAGTGPETAPGPASGGSGDGSIEVQAAEPTAAPGATGDSSAALSAGAGANITVPDNRGGGGAKSHTARGERGRRRRYTHRHKQGGRRHGMSSGSSSGSGSGSDSGSGSMSGSSYTGSGSSYTGSGSSYTVSGSSSEGSSTASPASRHRARRRHRRTTTPRRGGTRSSGGGHAASTGQGFGASSSGVPTFASPPLPSTSYFAMPGPTAVGPTVTSPFGMMVHGVQHQGVAPPPPPPPPHAPAGAATQQPPSAVAATADVERERLRERLASQEAAMQRMQDAVERDRESHHREVDRLERTIARLRDFVEAPRATPSSAAAADANAADGGAADDQPTAATADEGGGGATGGATPSPELLAELMDLREALRQSRASELEARTKVIELEARAPASPTVARSPAAVMPSPAAEAEHNTSEEALTLQLAQANARVQALEQEVTSLERQLATAKSSAEELQSRLAKRTEECDRLHGRLADMEAEAKAGERRARSDASNMQQFEHERDVMRRQLRERQAQVDAAEKQVAYLKERVDSLKDDHERVQTVAASERARADAAAAEAERWRLHCRQFESELAAFRGHTGGVLPTGESSTPVTGPGASPRGRGLGSPSRRSPSPGRGFPPLSPSQIRERDRRGDGAAGALGDHRDSEGVGALLHGDTDDMRQRERDELERARRARVAEAMGAEAQQQRVDATETRRGRSPTRHGNRDRHGDSHQRNGDAADPAAMDPAAMEAQWRAMVLEQERKDAARSASPLHSRFDAAADDPPTRARVVHSPPPRVRSPSPGSAERAREQRLKEIEAAKERAAARRAEEQRKREEVRREREEAARRAAAEQREANRERRMRRQKEMIDEYAARRAHDEGATPFTSRGSIDGDVASIMRREAQADAERRRQENVREFGTDGYVAGDAGSGAAHESPRLAAPPSSAVEARARGTSRGARSPPRQQPMASTSHDAGHRSEEAPADDALAKFRAYQRRAQERAEQAADSAPATAASWMAPKGSIATEVGDSSGGPPHHGEDVPRHHGRARVAGRDANVSRGFQSAWGNVGSGVDAPANPGEAVPRPTRKPVPAPRERPTARSAREREAAAPFATQASMQVDIAKLTELEGSLLRLNMEKDGLESELGRLGPTAGRTIASRRRKAQIESRLEQIASESSKVRGELRRLEPPV